MEMVFPMHSQKLEHMPTFVSRRWSLAGAAY